MAGPKVYLNTQYVDSEGNSAVYVTVNIDGKTIWFKTGVKANPNNFTISGRIKGKSSSVADDNLSIERVLAQINDIMVRYRLSGLTLTAELLKNEYKNPSRRIDFYAFADEVMKERKPDIANQTYKNISSSIKKMKEYQDSLAFSEITPEWLTKFARYMRVKLKNDQNTVFSTMKNLKALMNIAIRKKIIESTPFDKYQAKKVKTDRIYLDKKELKKLWDLYNSDKISVAKKTNLRHFLFMCLTGCRISDFKALTKESVIDNTLVYGAQKTKREKRTVIRVPLTTEAQRLIRDEPTSGNKLFQAISEQKFRKYIKEICQSHGINKDVSLHTARHTFATIFIEETKDVVSLQKLLGHSRITDTMIYVHMSDEAVRESMCKFRPLE
ncbi:MAG TPA: hypothetical protein DCY35_03710 [Prolixibacteraceae bacterium]|nr:hypothetical protein [Prolixibacteraceae bacterium]